MTQVRARTSLEVVRGDLLAIIGLPDPEAADALNIRFSAWMQVEKRSYAERGIICREFDRRELWRHLTDPDTGLPLPNFSAWMSCSLFLGCRRTNFEAKADVLALADVPDEQLLGVEKENLKVLKLLSTAVRNDPDVLEAARTLPREAFEEKVEREQPHQHIEARKTLRFTPERSGAAVIEDWIAFALDTDMAGSRDEAIVRACEIALSSARAEESDAETEG